MSMHTNHEARRRFDIPCTIEVEHTNEHFHAHVALEGDPILYPGDRVHVHGGPVMVDYGARSVVQRTATVMRAGPLRRAWTKLRSHFDLTELYEVSFSAGRGL